MNIDVSSSNLLGFFIALGAVFLGGLIYGLRHFNSLEWITVGLGIFGLSTLVLGGMRVYGRDGCHSGLHGLPFLNLTEPFHPYLSFLSIGAAIAVGIYDSRKKR